MSTLELWETSRLNDSTFRLQEQLMTTHRKIARSGRSQMTGLCLLCCTA